jgi:hypothetical protein
MRLLKNVLKGHNKHGHPIVKLLPLGFCFTNVNCAICCICFIDVKIGLPTSLRVSENKILIRIFEPKRYEIKGEQRRLHNKELRNLYSYTELILRLFNKE